MHRLIRGWKLSYAGNNEYFSREKIALYHSLLSLLTQPFLVLSRNVPTNVSGGGALRDHTKNGCVADYSLLQDISYQSHIVCFPWPVFSFYKVDYSVTQRSFNFPKKHNLPLYFVSASDGTNVVKVRAHGSLFSSATCYWIYKWTFSHKGAVSWNLSNFQSWQLPPKTGIGDTVNTNWSMDPKKCPPYKEWQRKLRNGRN